MSSAEKIICGTCKKCHRSSVDNTNQSGVFLQKKKNPPLHRSVRIGKGVDARENPFRLAAARQSTFPKGTAFGGGGKVSGIAQRRPLGGAGAQRLRGVAPREDRAACTFPLRISPSATRPAPRTNRGTRRCTNGASRGLFTKGLEVFDKCHEEGIIEKVITTNLTYQLPELASRDWYVSADMSKYIALIIDHLNHDASLSDLLDPSERISARIAEYKVKHTISDNYENY